MSLINETSPIYEHPTDINIQLKKHQLSMLHKALEIEKNYELGIMKDKPGSGKTYVVLSMIHELKKKDILDKKNKKVNVIIVPHNIYFQWNYSIERLTDNLNYVKFVEYEHLLNLYNHPEDLYEKDIILVSSSYYNVLSSTMNSLKLNVDRLFIDEIDNVGNLINQSFNTKFTMFISASFDVNHNNGFFSKKLLEMDLEDMTILCSEEFVDKQLDLEEPIHENYLCSNIYVDKVLDSILSKNEIKNVNACYFKIDDINYDQKIATNEINLISLILRENNNLIDNYENQLTDLEKNTQFYIEKKEKRNDYIDGFNKNMSGISKIFDLKKRIVSFIDNYLNYFDFYINPKLDFEFRDMYDILVEKRRNNIKEFRMYLNNLMDSIYHFYSLKMNNQEGGINEENIHALTKVYSLLNHLIKDRPKEIVKLLEDLESLKKDNKLNIECLQLYDQIIDFDNYVIEFTEILENLKIVLKCDSLIENLEKNKKDVLENKEFYKQKKDCLTEKLKDNHMCPICYCLLSNTEKIYVSQCCIQKMCQTCVEEWTTTYKKEKCVYCNIENKKIEDYLILEEGKTEEGDDILEIVSEPTHVNYTVYKYSKLHFIEEYIKDLKHKNQKLLLFSDFSNVFNNIQVMCKNYDIEYEDLEKGNMIDIEKAVMNYKYGNAKILLANSSLFSCGMNLENSTHVIFVHKIDEDILEQVLGRAQRLGRNCVLNVIHLEYENEIEIEKEKPKKFVVVEKDSTSIEALQEQGDQFDDTLLNENEEVELPDYNEVIDVNLEHLIETLH